ncbi:hypothetical protein TNIN_79721 [Trichonephila inaurata madagascariensis]|uniref:Uncharacterized protein n=1 Tax=Trichonephila inaurata madagascariensis TaxID=2747483 RepID=A0A8X7BYK7_9ARAC|nr:hypothetical protein TNIN_79721 [Trichonephila inaurata madagascariensis]
MHLKQILLNSSLILLSFALIITNHDAFVGTYLPCLEQKLTHYRCVCVPNTPRADLETIEVVKVIVYALVLIDWQGAIVTQSGPPAEGIDFHCQVTESRHASVRTTLFPTLGPKDEKENRR